MPFTGLLLEKTDAGFAANFRSLNESDLPPGEVLIRVSHSSLNYKDALGIHNRAPVIRRFPMVAGIDVAGMVEEVADHHPGGKWRVGDVALVTGFGLGETRWGGLAQLCRVPADYPVRLPGNMTPATAMSIGTAGLTAMFCVNALERAGLQPGQGDVLATGAVGGVGSMAVFILARLGYRVIAATGRVAEADYLKSLGAAEIMDRAELSAPGKPLRGERWIAAIDTVGSHTLANVCAGTRERGWVAACGMAQGLDFPATVAPFILRGISLIGVESSRMPMAERMAAWKRLAELVDPEKLATMTRRIRLDEAIIAADDLLAGKVRGRLLVEVA
jgi:acrylyl-CoA reductase (NADPH)